MSAKPTLTSVFDVIQHGANVALLLLYLGLKVETGKKKLKYGLGALNFQCNQAN